MSATWEFWMTDANGTRIALLSEYSFFAYTRSMRGLGTLEIGYPYDLLKEKVVPIFLPDRRIEVWYSPIDGIPLGLERIYFLRKPKYYRRETDNVGIALFYGRDGKDLMNRRYIIQDADTSYTTKTDNIDDMMKEVVREQSLYGSCVDQDGNADNTRAYPEGEFFVQGDVSLGPSITQSFSNKKVFDVLQDLRDVSLTKNEEDEDNQKIYWDVVEIPLGDGRFGFQFRTYAGMRGADRTKNQVYSVENGNLVAPYYADDRLDEVNSVIIKGQGSGEDRNVQQVDATDRIYESLWNRHEKVIQASQESTNEGLQSAGEVELRRGAPKKEIYCTFLNAPETPDTPRSLYRIDWDLGDMLPVEMFGVPYQAEVQIIYVSVNENNEINIIGRNTTG